MTDNEIIEFVEHAMHSAKGEDGFKDIYWERFKDILDLINRHKAENERLQKERQLINEDLTNALTKMRALRENIKIAKSEAIKEFAERLKGYAKELKIGDNIYLQVVGIGRIDNLVKEMEGK